MKARARAPKSKASAALGPLPADAVLMALDVSSTAIGWAVYRRGVLASASVIRAGASRPSHERIEAHTLELGEVFDSYAPTLAVMEWQSPWRAARCRNANGLAVLGQAQGAAFWEMRRREIPVELVSERVWTKVGGWPVSKRDRAERIKLLVPEYRKAIERNPGMDKGLDLADALGIALWRLSR